MKKILSISLLTMLPIIAVAQPSDAEVISYVKSQNSKINKVTVGSKDKRLESGVYKWFVAYSSYIPTDYPGITRVYRSQLVYVGSKVDRKLVGDDYFLGIDNPKKEDMERILNNDKLSVFGGKYGSLSAQVCNPTDFVVDDNSYYWGNLNAVSFLATCEYFEKLSGNRVQHVKHTMEFNLSRSVDGVNWDPKATYLPNGKWLVEGDNARRLAGLNKNREVLEESVYSDEEYNKLKSVRELYQIEQSKAYISSLPSVSIPEFNSDKHAIQYLHELMIEGDKKKIEATLNEMAPNNWFTDRSNYIYTVNGANTVNGIVENAEMYKEYFCQHPQIKHQQDGMIQFLTRDLSSFGRIQVYKDNGGTWRFTAIEYPYGKGDRLAASQSAGDKNCGTPLDTGAPIEAIKYKIGDNVIGTIRGKSYPGKVEKIDDMMADRYFVRFEGTSAQWITADAMQPASATKSDNSKTESSDKKNGEAADKAKKGLNSLKNKVGI